MEQELRDHLLALAAAFMAATEMSRATLGKRVAGDWRFFDRITGGKTFNIRTYDTATVWFSANWPEGAAWPDGVPRPAVAVAVAADASEAAA